jgi:hypothetical protein
MMNNKKYLTGYLPYLALAAALLAVTPPGLHAQDNSFTNAMPAVETPAPQLPDESQVKVTLHVDQANPAAADQDGAGTEKQPFKTISAAITAANTGPMSKGQGTKVLVHPGVYRESVTMSGGYFDRDKMAMTTKPWTGVLLVLEGTKAGEVVISGSDLLDVSKFQPVEGLPGVYSAPWPYGFGFYDGRWGKYNPPKQLGHRREMVFINGQALRQMMLDDWEYTRSTALTGSGTHIYKGTIGPEILEPGCFGLVESDSKDGPRTLYIRLPEGTPSLQGALVEASVRGKPLPNARGPNAQSVSVSGMENVVLRNLVIQHFTPGFNVAGGLNLGDEPPYSGGSKRILIDHCEVRWNNAYGISILAVTQLHLRNVNVHNNGDNGIGGGYLLDSTFQDVDIIDNGWRIALGGEYGWGSGGLKFWCSGHNVYERVRSQGNFGHGFWLDGQNTHSIWRDCDFSYNQRGGLFIEISEGPFLVENSRMERNVEFGLRVTESHDVLVTNCVIQGNRDTQIQIPYKKHGRNVGKAPDGSVKKEDPMGLAPWRRTFLPNIKLQNVVIRDSVIATDVTAEQVGPADRSWFGVSMLLSPRKGVGPRDVYLSTGLKQLNFINITWFSPTPDQAFSVDGDNEKIVNLAEWQKLAQESGSQWAKPQNTPAKALPVWDLDRPY